MFHEPRFSEDSTDCERPPPSGFVPIDQLLAAAAFDPASLDPVTVRAIVLTEHGKIRELLARLESDVAALLACSVPKTNERHAVRQLALQLCSEMSAHVAFENQVLVPVIERVDAWGQVRAERILEEHAEQVQLLRAYADMLASDEDTSQTLSVTVWRLVETIRQDMRDEEADVLSPEVLSDHIGQCVETG